MLIIFLHLFKYLRNYSNSINIIAFYNFTHEAMIDEKFNKILPRSILSVEMLFVEMLFVDMLSVEILFVEILSIEMQYPCNI